MAEEIESFDTEAALKDALARLLQLADILERRMTMKIKLVDEYIPVTRKYVEAVCAGLDQAKSEKKKAQEAATIQA